MRRWTPAIVFLVALAVRLAVTFELQGTAIFRTPQLDSLEYLSWAQRIAAGNFAWPAAASHGPGYPLFLGLLLAIGGGSIVAAHIVQAFLGAATAVVISLIARRIYDDMAALTAGLLTAVYAPLVLVDVSIYAEGLFVFLLSCSLLAIVSLQSRPALASFLCGTALGVAIIVRPTAAILFPVYAWLVWRRARRALIAFVFAVVYPVVPVVASNWTATGDLLAVQSGGGLNFYIGNEPHHDGTAWARPGGSWDWVRGAAWRAGVRGAGAEDRYYTQRALHEMRASLFAEKLLRLFENDEIRDSHSFYFFQERATFLHLVPFAVVLALAVAGAWTRRANAATWLLVVYAVAMSITVVALVVGSRYRMPILPALLVLASGCVVPSPDWRVLGGAIAIAVLSAIWIHEPTHNLAEEWGMEGIALGKEGRDSEARAALETATKLNPGLAIAWTGLGDLRMRAGDLAGAESLDRHSLAVDPSHALTYSHLALARAAAGDRAGAIALLRQALAIRADRDAMYNLAGFLFADGDLAGAERWLRETLRKDPDDKEARIAFALVQASRLHH